MILSRVARLIALFSLCLLFAAAPGTPAAAHERSRSHSTWTLDGAAVSGRYSVDARLATLALTGAPPGASLDTALEARLSEGLTVTRGGTACTRDAPPRVLTQPNGRLHADMSWRCDLDDGELHITVNVIAPLAANHTHFLRLQRKDGSWDERVLSRNRTRAVFAAPPSPMASSAAILASYVRLGFEHILGGADHMAFLFALLLLARRVRTLIGVTLGFTLGHSITLALTALGLASPPTAAVEAVIGFSIVFVAGEAAFSEHAPPGRFALVIGALLIAAAAVSLVVGGAVGPAIWFGLGLSALGYGAWQATTTARRDLPAAMSTMFGLVHGVGFGGVLLASGLPEQRAVPALLGFNVGVEVGQLAVLALATSAALLIRRLAPSAITDTGRAAMTACVAGLGAFWFVSRTLSAL